MRVFFALIMSVVLVSLTAGGGSPWRRATVAMPRLALPNEWPKECFKRRLGGLPLKHVYNSVSEFLRVLNREFISIRLEERHGCYKAGSLVALRKSMVWAMPNR